MRSTLRNSIAAVAACVCLSSGASAEPLRLFVPEFSGPEPIGKYVMTTLFFEITKAFAARSPIEKGVWILYGHEPLEQETHDAAIRESSWPSVRADIVVWGSIRNYGDGIIVQSFLTITPLADERQVRPEIWSVHTTGRTDKTAKLKIGLPRRYYEFEPFRLSDDAIQKYFSPNGVPLYSSRNDGELVGFARGAFRIYTSENGGIQLEGSQGVRGWARLPELAEVDIQAITFSQSLIRYMRGDWRGAISALSNIAKAPETPQALRIDSLIYAGIAKEKIGQSGRSEFEKAYAINRLNGTSARYVIMGRISDIERLRRTGDIDSVVAGVRDLSRFIDSTRALFSLDDVWLREVGRLLNEWQFQLDRG